MPSNLEQRVAQLELELRNASLVPIQNIQTPPINVGSEDYKDFGSIKITRKGEVQYNVVEVTDDYTARENDRYIMVNQASGTKTVTLPTGQQGKMFTVKALTAVQVDVASSENIDGSASISLTSQYEWSTVVFQGTTWHQV